MDTSSSDNIASPDRQVEDIPFGLKKQSDGCRSLHKQGPTQLDKTITRLKREDKHIDLPQQFRVLSGLPAFKMSPGPAGFEQSLTTSLSFTFGFDTNSTEHQIKERMHMASLLITCLPDGQAHLK